MYSVDISEAALSDAEEHYRYVCLVKLEPEAAAKWFDGLYETIKSLRAHPARCAKAPGFEGRDADVRQLKYHSHWIYFRISNARQRVTVLRIYHSARIRPSAGDLDDPLLG